MKISLKHPFMLLIESQDPGSLKICACISIAHSQMENEGVQLILQAHSHLSSKFPCTNDLLQFSLALGPEPHWLCQLSFTSSEALSHPLCIGLGSTCKIRQAKLSKDGHLFCILCPPCAVTLSIIILVSRNNIQGIGFKELVYNDL